MQSAQTRACGLPQTALCPSPGMERPTAASWEPAALRSGGWGEPPRPCDVCEQVGMSTEPGQGRASCFPPLRHLFANITSWVTAHQFSSVQFSRSVMSDSLRPHGLQHTRPPRPSSTPEFTQTHVHRVGDAIQPSHPVVPFSSHPQSLPASGSFSMSQLFASGGQSIGVSASASVLPMNI